MANQEHIAILKKGVKTWNEWKERSKSRFVANPKLFADLSEADLKDLDLSYIDFERIDLRGADLSHSNLFESRLTDAYLQGANLTSADLRGAELSYARIGKGLGETVSGRGGSHLDFFESAILKGVQLDQARIEYADLNGVNFENAELSQAIFRGGNFTNANLTNAKLKGTAFLGCDLSTIRGLETIKHFGPSNIDIDTLYLSKGAIPESFLRGAGVPDNFISYISSLIGAEQAIQFYSCFISYSHKDEEFAKRLYSRLRDAELRVWFAPEDLKGGRELYEQIDHAIQVYDRLLVVLSDDSLNSEWVTTEIRRALRAEANEKRRKLFPIRLIDMERLKEWECFDADIGKDIAVEMRKYFIPDFTDWKNHDFFELAFSKLISDLKDEEIKHPLA